MEKYDLLPQQLLLEGTIKEDDFFTPEIVPLEYVHRVHDPSYIKKLINLKLTRSEIRRIGFPLSKSLINREFLIAGGTLMGAEKALGHGISMNIAGGTHHAYPDRGEAFCLLNDQAIAAKFLLDAKKVKKILNLDSSQFSWDNIGKKRNLIPSSSLLNKGQLLFSKIDNDIIKKQLLKLKNGSNDFNSNRKTIPEIKPKVSFKNFENLNLKIAEIINAKKVKKTKKLIELEVKLGKKTRTVVSGIAKDFDEKDIVGKKVVLLENLFPKKLKGIESNGMVLLSKNENGNFIFIGPDLNDIESGTIIY